MRLEGYRLLERMRMGQDGVAYRAETADGGPVVVCVLGAARAQATRWPELTRRLKRVALLRHPGAVGVSILRLEHDPPYAVLDAVSTATLAEELGPRRPLPPPQALALCHPLAEALAAAHRIGLVHGGVRPETVFLPMADRPQLDFTGLALGGPAGAEVTAQDPADDSTGLGQVLAWLLTDHQGPEATALDTAATLVRELLTADPAERLPVREAAERLAKLLLPFQATACVEPPGSTAVPEVKSTRTEAIPRVVPVTGLARRQLGRFRLLEKLGQGAMGAVYRAEDITDGRIVALKVLRAGSEANSQLVRRFHKEARLLAEINNPYVANLLEVNEDAGMSYLVLEFVPGRSLDRLLAERGRLEEREALAILADVARGLADAHARGIVHRDVKPENILLETGNREQGTDQLGNREQGTGNSKEPSSRFSSRAKLSDFGLARHVIETESLNMTRAGTILGTLLYMAPEQCAGSEVDARADVYSMGATLYHVLAGRPPFTAETTLALIAQHTSEPPPPLRRFNPSVSDAVCQVIEKALAKAPDARYADAGALLEDLQRLLRGEPTGMAAHPRRPTCDPAHVLRYEWSWDLQAAPELLWPYISNTERFNRAAGLTPVQFRVQVEEEEKAKRPENSVKPARVRRFGSFRKASLSVSWEEHPFEWVEARRMGVLREYSEGPFKWLMSATELQPRGKGTRLIHKVELEPRGVLGRTLAAVEVGVRSRRSVERIYRRIDALLTEAGTASRGLVDAFEEPGVPTRAQRRRLQRLPDELVRRGVTPDVAEQLIDFVAHAPPQEVGRIRPLVLARRLGLDPDAMVAACLHGVRAGLLVLLWDIICPLCRIPSAVKDTLRLLREHEHCVACAEEFPVDFGSSVELIFRAHPEVRTTEVGAFCIGGPAHSPHVVAQARVAPGERVELSLSLVPGAYRLRGPQLAYRLDFQVEDGAGVARWDLALTRPPGQTAARVLRAASQVLVLTNDHAGELVVRIERAAPRADALTAVRASALGLFRELFPDEILSPGQLVSVTAVTLLVTQPEGADELYADLGDARAFTTLHDMFRLLGDCIRAGGGAVIKTIGEGIMASFADAEAAVRTGLELQGVLAASAATQGLCLRIGIHRGPALAATVNDQLDYFGTTVRQALALPAAARGAGLVLTKAVAEDPAVQAMLRDRGLEGEWTEIKLRESGLASVQCFRAQP